MAKTKVFDKTQLDNVYLILTHNPDGSATAMISMVGLAISQDGSKETVSMEYAYSDLASAQKNQCSSFVKFFSRLFNEAQVDEDSETITELK